MKKRYIVILIMIFISAGVAQGMGEKAPPKSDPSKSFLIDDFESGSIKSPREWWTFSIGKAAADPNRELKKGDPRVASQVGNYSLLLSGAARDRFVGGCGTYLAKGGQDLSKYNNFQMDIYGRGRDSGELSIELIDDDNHNWQRGEDPKSYAPLYDDKFVYRLKVDWEGWKRVSVPLADFKDANPKVGDDIWNPAQTGGSGGLLQMEFLVYAQEAAGRVELNLDNICLAQGE